MCSRFLWSGNTDCMSKAKVSWSTMCLPKEEGGLDLRSLSIWNRVLCLRFIWLLLSGSASLWASWLRQTHLQEKSLWALNESTMDSWIWKQILKLRTEAIRFIKPILGNDQTTSFWYDVWTPFGQLITYLGERGPSQLRVPLHGSISDACSTTGWSIASPRSDEALELQIYLTCVP